MPIAFTNVVDTRFGCFSSRSEHAFFLNNLYWKTVEHYFHWPHCRLGFHGLPNITLSPSLSPRLDPPPTG
jgi:hypothetical protein